MSHFCEKCWKCDSSGGSEVNHPVHKTLDGIQGNPLYKWLEKRRPGVVKWLTEGLAHARSQARPQVSGLPLRALPLLQPPKFSSSLPAPPSAFSESPGPTPNLDTLSFLLLFMFLFFSARARFTGFLSERLFGIGLLPDTLVKGPPRFFRSLNNNNNKNDND